MGLLSIIKGVADAIPFLASIRNSVKKDKLAENADLPIVNKIFKSVDFLRLFTMILVTLVLLIAVFKVQDITFDELLQLITIFGKQ